MGKSIGSYVDIGAGTPIWGSNSYYFYKRGWKGVTVDPIEFNILLHKILRKNDFQYKALVSNSSLPITFYELIPWELSTTDYSTAMIRVERGAQLIRQETLNVITLSEIYNKVPMIRPAILSIDVEGAEMDVLLSNEWNKYHPDYICIEELESPLYKSDIKNFLEEKQYRLIIYNGVTSIYYWEKSEYKV